MPVHFFKKNCAGIFLQQIHLIIYSRCTEHYIKLPRPSWSVAELSPVSFQFRRSLSEEKSFLNKSERFLSRRLLRNDNLLTYLTQPLENWNNGVMELTGFRIIPTFHFVVRQGLSPYSPKG